MNLPVSRVAVAVLGVALGGLGLGWSGEPGAERVIPVVRARLVAEMAGVGDLHVVSVRRDWLHELASSKPSEFLVKVAWTAPGGDPRDACFRYQNGRMPGTDWAIGPQSVETCG